MTLRAQRRFFLAVLACLTVSSVSAQAGVLQVSYVGATGFKTIQAAVDVATDGDTVIINPGVYRGPDNCDIDLGSKKITIQSTNPSDVNVVDATIIDCTDVSGQPHRAFYVAGCSGAEISGLTITNGLSSAGGAIYCKDSTLLVTYCRILRNATEAGRLDGDRDGGPGGAIYATSSILTLRNCIVIQNTTGAGLGDGGDGAGVFCTGTGRLVVENCQISRNSAGDGGAAQGTSSSAGNGGCGGGIYCAGGCVLEVRNSRIEGNVTGTGGSPSGNGGDGAGVYCTAGSLNNCLVAGNKTGGGGQKSNAGRGGHGGGIYCESGALTVINCTIAENVTGTDDSPTPTPQSGRGEGGDIYTKTSLLLRNSIMWGNRSKLAGGHNCSSLFYSVVEGQVCSQGQGNISADPLFVQPGRWVDANDPNTVVVPETRGAVWVKGDYHLRANSLCRDAGNADYIASPDETDLDGQPRVTDAKVNMGAYETPSLMPVYRFWSPITGKHFYTASQAEKDALVSGAAWLLECVAYDTYVRPSEQGLLPVYRFWSNSIAAHFWTIDDVERDFLINNYPDVWTYEGVVFYAYPKGQQPPGAKGVYRFWSPKLNAHFYTIRDLERDKLLADYADTWVYEDIAWFAYEGP